MTTAWHQWNAAINLFNNSGMELLVIWWKHDHMKVLFVQHKTHASWPEVVSHDVKCSRSVLRVFSSSKSRSAHGKHARRKGQFQSCPWFKCRAFYISQLFVIVTHIKPGSHVLERKTNRKALRGDDLYFTTHRYVSPISTYVDITAVYQRCAWTEIFGPGLRMRPKGSGFRFS